MYFQLPSRPLTRRESILTAAVLTILAVIVLLLHGCADACAAPIVSASESVDDGAHEIITQMSVDYHVEVGVVIAPCGERNSYYWPTLHMIVICSEMRDAPRVEKFFAAHEVGHAITHKYANMSDEEAADELATLALIEHGDLEAALSMAEYWLARSHPEALPTDGHPHALYRAWEIVCLVTGSMPPDLDLAPSTNYAACAEYYHATKMRWEHRLQGARRR